MFKKTKAI